MLQRMLFEIPRHCQQSGGAGSIVVGPVIDFAIAYAEMIVMGGKHYIAIGIACAADNAHNIIPLARGVVP